jgi:hypothetical protein
MSQQAAVTLNTVAYAPSGLRNGIAIWTSRVGGLLAGFSKLTQSYKDPVTGTQTKIDFQISVPVLATADSSCGCAGDLLRTNSASISFWVAASSTLAERTDLYLRVKDLIAASVVTDAVESLNPASS